jgi:hypothetical protein
MQYFEVTLQRARAGENCMCCEVYLIGSGYGTIGSARGFPTCHPCSPRTVTHATPPDLPCLGIAIKPRIDMGSFEVGTFLCLGARLFLFSIHRSKSEC